MYGPNFKSSLKMHLIPAALQVCIFMTLCLKVVIKIVEYWFCCLCEYLINTMREEVLVALVYFVDFGYSSKKCQFSFLLFLVACGNSSRACLWGSLLSLHSGRAVKAQFLHQSKQACESQMPWILKNLKKRVRRPVEFLYFVLYFYFCNGHKPLSLYFLYISYT